MDYKKSKKNIILLGMVSLFTDLSTQMIYPLIPEFLVSIGARKALIGIIEGIAESTASLFRPVFGRLSDKLRKRKLLKRVCRKVPPKYYRLGVQSLTEGSVLLPFFNIIIEYVFK